MEALKVENLAVAYDKKKVLQNVNISVPTGHLTAIIGPNGAGKSTLLKAILNQLPNKVGRVEILGKAFSPKSLIVGYLPQRNAVDWDFPTTALDVVLMGRYGHRGFLFPEQYDLFRRREWNGQVNAAGSDRIRFEIQYGGRNKKL